MGYNTDARGQICIDPPIPWGEIKDSPFLPENARARATERDIMFCIDSEEVETAEGTLTRRTAVAMEQSWGDDSRNYNIVAHLQEALDLYGKDHTFTGRFDMEGADSGDIWRVCIRGGKAVRVDPIVTWPEED
jgi:hypothetical protein